METTSFLCSNHDTDRSKERPKHVERQPTHTEKEATHAWRKFILRVQILTTLYYRIIIMTLGGLVNEKHISLLNNKWQLDSIIILNLYEGLAQCKLRVGNNVNWDKKKNEICVHGSNKIGLRLR